MHSSFAGLIGTNPDLLNSGGFLACHSSIQPPNSLFPLSIICSIIASSRGDERELPWED